MRDVAERAARAGDGCARGHHTRHPCRLAPASIFTFVASKVLSHHVSRFRVSIGVDEGRSVAASRPSRASRRNSPDCVSMCATTLAALRVAALSATSTGTAKSDEGCERRGHGVAGAGRARHRCFDRRTVDDAAVGANERTAAAVGEHHVARAEPAQCAQERRQAHLIAAADEAARQQRRRLLAGVERQTPIRPRRTWRREPEPVRPPLAG